MEALAVALRERGIEPWLDKWEIGPGDDIVASINRGLDEADAGIIVFSEHSGESRWVEAEVGYLTYARIVESKALIPVVRARVRGCRRSSVRSPAAASTKPTRSRTR